MKRIGTGAYGSVYKAYVCEEMLTLRYVISMRLDNRETIAVKILNLEESKDSIESIHQETKALADGATCPQVVNYYGTILNEFEIWILMEFVSGGSLYDIVCSLV